MASREHMGARQAKPSGGGELSAGGQGAEGAQAGVEPPEARGRAMAARVHRGARQAKPLGRVSGPSRGARRGEERAQAESQGGVQAAALTTAPGRAGRRKRRWRQRKSPRRNGSEEMRKKGMRKMGKEEP